MSLYLQPFALNFVDEQSGEKSHKRYKYSRPHLSRKNSAEDNLSDMMSCALAWSDPKMSYLSIKKCKRSKQRIGDDIFETKMQEYFVDETVENIENDDDSEDNSDHDLDFYSSSSDEED